MLDSVDHMVGFGEVDLVLISDNLPLRLGLQRHLNDISRFIIKKTVRISKPGNCTEKDAKK